jgi:hypothetical protein
MNTMTEILNDLSGYANNQDTKLQSLAAITTRITEDYQNGLLGATEYSELLEDIALQNSIVNLASELAAQKQLNTIINAAITMAAIAAKAI